MQIELKTAKIDGKTNVEYYKDGKLVSRQETANPFQYITTVLNRVGYNPHIITDIYVKITGLEVPGKN